jgi:putative exosortase-associated protein (TIGR04073 family)
MKENPDMRPIQIHSRSIRSVRLAAIAILCCAVVFPLAGSADTVGEKALRGLAGMFTPFLELPGNIVRTWEREGAEEGWTEGLARGIGMSVVRPPVGFYEFVTAPFPMTSPRGYEPILEPDYPWSYFSDADPDLEQTARRDR